MLEITPKERIEVASILKLHEQYLYQVLTKRRVAPKERCPDLERAFQGRVTCEVLRPDVVWHRVPDVDWPWHPNGRPTIDVVRSAPATMTTEGARDAA